MCKTDAPANLEKGQYGQGEHSIRHLAEKGRYLSYTVGPGMCLVTLLLKYLPRTIPRQKSIGIGNVTSVSEILDSSSLGVCVLEPPSNYDSRRRNRFLSRPTQSLTADPTPLIGIRPIFDLSQSFFVDLLYICTIKPLHGYFLWPLTTLKKHVSMHSMHDRSVDCSINRCSPFKNFWSYGILNCVSHSQ